MISKIPLISIFISHSDEDGGLEHTLVLLQSRGARKA